MDGRDNDPETRSGEMDSGDERSGEDTSRRNANYNERGRCSNNENRLEDNAGANGGVGNGDEGGDKVSRTGAGPERRKGGGGDGADVRSLIFW